MSGQAQATGYSGWRTVSRAYAFTFADLPLALRISAVWIVVSAAGSRVVSVLPKMITADFTLQGGLRSLMQCVLLLGYGLALTAVGVAWHRFVSRSEQPPTVPLPGREALPYFGWLTLAYVTAFFIPDVIQTIALSLSGNIALIASFQLRLLMRLAIALPILAVLLRFSLKLPAIAVGDREMTLRASWRATAPIWGGLVLGVIAAMAPQFAAQQLVSALLAAPVNEVFSYLAVFLYYGVNFVSFIVVATFLSMTYGRNAGDIAATFE